MFPANRHEELKARKGLEGAGMGTRCRALGEAALVSWEGKENEQ